MSYYMGHNLDRNQPSDYYTNTFGWGGDQTVYDTGTRTYSSRKDEYIGWLHSIGTLAPDWEAACYHKICQNGICTEVASGGVSECSVVGATCSTGGQTPQTDIIIPVVIGIGAIAAYKLFLKDILNEL